MRVTAEKCRGRDLKPGDLFSTIGEKYWSTIDQRHSSVGERVYIRTNTALNEAHGPDDVVYRLTVERP